MTRTFITLSAVSLLLMLAFISCKKKNDGLNTPAGQMVGYWSLSMYGADANENDTLDAHETFPVSGTGSSGWMTLRPDGTGTSYMNTVITGGPRKSEFLWALVDTNKTFMTVTGADTVYRPIQLRTTSNLTLFDTLASPVKYWEVWKK